MVSGNTNAATITIAEKDAERILNAADLRATRSRQSRVGLSLEGRLPRPKLVNDERFDKDRALGDQTYLEPCPGDQRTD